MKLKHFAMIALLAGTAGLAACDEDPTSSGVGEPEAIVTTLSQTSRARNTPFTITAYAVDKNLHRIPGALSVTPSPGVTVDSTKYIPELSETRLYLRTGGTAAPAPGVTVKVQGHSLEKDIQVIIT